MIEIEPMVETDAPVPTWSHGPGYWRRILVVNALGAAAAFGLLGGLVSTAPWSMRWRALVASLVYANVIGGIMALVMPSILLRFKGSSWTISLLVRLVTIPVVIVAGCAMAGVVLIAIGLSRPDEYGAFMSGSLWISLLVGTVASLSVTGYETMRGQLEVTSLALKSKQLDEERARKLALEAQLASLESRVHPHFLFNTLNSISELVHDDPAAAERVIGQLASLLRSSLDSGSLPLVPLEQEFRIVRDYLAIERVRFGERLRYELHLPDGLADVLVPRLALQTIVENSVKHAVSPRREGASIVVRATESGSRIRLDVEDDGPGFDADAVPDGHGLALVRARLAMTSGGRASLHIESSPGRSCVSLDLPRDGWPT